MSVDTDVHLSPQYGKCQQGLNDINMIYPPATYTLSGETTTKESKMADTYHSEDHFNHISFPPSSPGQESLFTDHNVGQGQEMVWLTHRSLQFIRSQNNKKENRSDTTGKGKICVVLSQLITAESCGKGKDLAEQSQARGQGHVKSLTPPLRVCKTFSKLTNYSQVREKNKICSNELFINHFINQGEREGAL